MTLGDTAESIRDYLASLLTSYLGQFDNGQPRIWVSPPAPPAASGKSLECVIQRQPRGVSQSSSGNQRFRAQVFEVSLTNWGNDTSLIRALETMDRDNQLSFARDHSYIPVSSLNPEQAKVYIQAPKMINREVLV